MEVVPSPKFHNTEEAPVVKLVNATEAGVLQKAVVLAEKEGTGFGATVTCLLAESRQPPKLLINLTV